MFYVENVYFNSKYHAESARIPVEKKVTLTEAKDVLNAAYFYMIEGRMETTTLVKKNQSRCYSNFP